MKKHSILRTEIREIKNKFAKDRTEEEHFKLIKAFGGIRNYFLSMGIFKDVKIDKEEKMYCRKCLKNGKKINMKIDYQKKEYICPKCKYKVKWQE